MDFEQVNKAFANMVQGEVERKMLVQMVAIIFAEHDAMKERLLELGEVYDEVPIRWTATGETLVPDLQVAIENYKRKAWEKYKK